jgi:hypothetical protein
MAEMSCKSHHFVLVDAGSSDERHITGRLSQGSVKIRQMSDIPRYRLVVLTSVLVLASASAAQSPVSNLNSDRYPNELPGYRFHRNAKWSHLEPLKSSMEDVRKLLGDPDEASDTSQSTEPYPGDTVAKQPVFTYTFGPNWEVLVYFTRYCFHHHDTNVASDRLCSIDLVPRKRVSFREVVFPPVFKKEHVTAADAAWDEYSDGTGLRYEVYTTRTPYGDERPGDLNRISYGPPEPR